MAHVRSSEQEAFVREIGADAVVAGDDLEPARQHGPYALMLDSVGGAVLGQLLGLVEEGTKIVSIGTSAGDQVHVQRAKVLRHRHDHAVRPDFV